MSFKRIKWRISIDYTPARKVPEFRDHISSSDMRKSIAVQYTTQIYNTLIASQNVV